MAATNPYKREGPFLHRVWRSAVDYISPANGDKTLSGDNSPRAVKRRRITDESPDSNAVSSLPPLFTAPNDNHERSLRIDVLRMDRPDGRPPQLNGLLDGNVNGSPAKRDIPTVKARCKVSIFKWVKNVEVRILHCDSQICMVKLLRDPDGACRTARIHLPQPFLIPADKICMELDYDQGFGVANDYLVSAELESAGDPSWPPMELLHGYEEQEESTNPPRQWVLGCRVVYNFKKPRMTSVVTLRKSKNPKENPTTKWEMGMDLRWSVFNNAGDTIRPSEGIMQPAPIVNGALEPLTNGHVNGRVDIPANGQAKDDADGIMYEDEEVAGEGEQTTPSRSLRIRGKQQNYNLKLLSDKARGKEGKERKKRKAEEADGGQVVWLLPSNGRVTLENWSCIRCYASHSSFEQLKLHLTAHPEFKYSYDPSKGVWRITLSRHGQVTPRSMRSSEIREPLSPIEHEDSGSEDEATPHKARAESQPITIPEPKLLKPAETKQTIPSNKQSLFDRISKVEFEPGTTVDEPMIDNTWLVQKHRDIIRDYTDVNNEEKEFIYEWDAFAHSQKTTLSPHLNEIFLDFLVEKTAWLAASESHMTETTKFMCYLKARDALNEATLKTAFEIMRRARLQMKDEQPEPVKTSPPRAEYRKSESGCGVCGQPVLGPGVFICSKKECQKPYRHVDCLGEEASVAISERCCNACRSQAEEPT